MLHADLLFTVIKTPGQRCNLLKSNGLKYLCVFNPFPQLTMSLCVLFTVSRLNEVNVLSSELLNLIYCEIGSQ